jgi:hypothetical protein
MRWWWCILGLQVTAFGLTRKLLDEEETEGSLEAAPTPPPTPSCPQHCADYEPAAQCSLPECASCAPWPAPCAVTTPPPFLTEGSANESSATVLDGMATTTPLPATTNAATTAAPTSAATAATAEGQPVEGGTTAAPTTRGPSAWEVVREVQEVINKTRDANQRYNETLAKWREDWKTTEINQNVMHINAKAVRPTYSSDFRAKRAAYKGLRAPVNVADYEPDLQPLVSKVLGIDKSWGAAKRADRKCIAHCLAAGHCCNDHRVGSNKLLSCAQACIARARGLTKPLCLAECDKPPACSRSIGAYQYWSCGECEDKTEKCPLGVQTADECRTGCEVDPDDLGVVDGFADR